MPTYEYECRKCGLKFECYQAITEAPVADCPECQGEVHRILSGGAGFIMKGSGSGRTEKRDGTCSLEDTGKTCCGRAERCSKPPCGSKP